MEANCASQDHRHTVLSISTDMEAPFAPHAVSVRTYCCYRSCVAAAVVLVLLLLLHGVRVRARVCVRVHFVVAVVYVLQLGRIMRRRRSERRVATQKRDGMSSAATIMTFRHVSFFFSTNG